MWHGVCSQAALMAGRRSPQSPRARPLAVSAPRSKRARVVSCPRMRCLQAAATFSSCGRPVLTGSAQQCPFDSVMQQRGCQEAKITLSAVRAHGTLLSRCHHTAVTVHSAASIKVNREPSVCDLGRGRRDERMRSHSIKKTAVSSGTG